MERNILPNYNEHVCNIVDCDKPIYKSGMCKEHYRFYISSPETADVINEMAKLKSGTASWGLKFKRVLHWICHLVMDIPMTLYEHFPLEHVFLAELKAARKMRGLDTERICKVVRDFDVVGNENIATMKNLMDNADVEHQDFQPKEEYYLTSKNLPARWFPLISILGVLGFSAFYIYMPEYDTQIFYMPFLYVKLLSFKLAPYIIALAVFMMIGLSIPYQYNSFINKCFGLTLFEKLEDNLHVLNEIKFVKERKVRAKGYYASFIGVALGAATICLFDICCGDGGFKWEFIPLAINYTITIIPIIYAFHVMALYYPVMNAFTHKRVSIDLYNSDNCGGLRRYHTFLFLIFIYCEGFSLVLLKIIGTVTMPLGVKILLGLIILMRLRHAGMAIINWIRSVRDFYAAKHIEEDRLASLPGSVENMTMANTLRKTSPFILIPYIIKLIIFIIIPYLINQLPTLQEALVLLGLK